MSQLLRLAVRYVVGWRYLGRVCCGNQEYPKGNGNDKQKGKKEPKKCLGKKAIHVNASR
jgi:hypothetical protein